MIPIPLIETEEEKAAFLQMCDLVLQKAGLGAHKVVTHFLDKIAKAEAGEPLPQPEE